MGMPRPVQAAAAQQAKIGRKEVPLGSEPPEFGDEVDVEQVEIGAEIGSSGRQRNGG